MIHEVIEEAKIDYGDPRAEHLAHQRAKSAKVAQKAALPQQRMVDADNRHLDEWVVKNLKAEDINWLHKLLSNELNLCTYRDFARVWKRLNGENAIVASKKGTSHFKLLNSGGFVVGGIFSHGKGQEYWGSAIHDLIKHFKAISIDKDLMTNALAPQ